MILLMFWGKGKEDVERTQVPWWPCTDNPAGGDEGRAERVTGSSRR